MNSTKGVERACTCTSQAYPDLGTGLVTMTASKPGERRDGPARVFETHCGELLLLLPAAALLMRANGPGVAGPKKQ